MVAKSLVLLLTVAAVPRGALGAEYFVDPVNGDAGGDGSELLPWGSLQQVLDDGLVASFEPAELPFDGTGELVERNPGAPVQGGDTIWLMTGEYGALTIENFYNDEWITVAALEGETPRFSGVLVRGSAKWRLKGLSVSAEHAETYEVHTLVDLDSHNWRGPVHEVEIAKCHIRSVADTSSWSAEDWDSLACNGIQVDGWDHLIRDNLLENVNFGISVSADTTLVRGNTIDGFSGDGMRGLGDFGVFEYNTVKNCYDVNENHDDGFQSWSNTDEGVGTGEVRGVVLRGNLIINYEDPNQPHRGTLQGIGCFDGTFVDWVVENNVVITDHWHGITLSGARNCKLVNNTVMDLNDEEPGPPWVSIGAHKDGTPPVDCVVRNNLTTAVNCHEDVTVDSNILIEDAAALFVDPAHFDLHLLPTAEAVDTGSLDLASSHDKDGIPRPQGAGVDVGAYEWHEDDVEPEIGTDAGIPEGDTDLGTDEPGDVAEAEEGATNDSCGCQAVGASSNPFMLGALLQFFCLTD